MACVDYDLLQGSAGTASQCTASSRVSASYEAVEAWDGICDGADSTDNAWIDNNEGTSAWIQWDFPIKKKLRCFRFQIRELDGSYDSWPSSVTWRAKNDGDTWQVDDVELFTGTITGYDSLAPGDWTSWFEFDSDDVDSFDSYRMYVDGIYILNGAFTRSQIQEFEFYEEITPLSFDNFGVEVFVNAPIMGNIGVQPGVSFPFGYPYSLSDPLTVAASLVMRAFGIESYFSAHTFMELNAFSIDSIISKVINTDGLMMLKGLSVSATCGTGRFATATFNLPGFTFTASVSKDKLITGALTLKALSADAVMYELSTVDGDLELTPFQLRSRGLQDLDYFVLRYVR